MIFGVDFGLGPKSSFFFSRGKLCNRSGPLSPPTVTITTVNITTVTINIVFINYYLGQLLVPAEGFGQPCPHIFMTINVSKLWTYFIIFIKPAHWADSI